MNWVYRSPLPLFLFLFCFVCSCPCVLVIVYARDVLMINIAVHDSRCRYVHSKRVLDLYPLTINETNLQTKTTCKKYIYRLWGRCGVLKKSRTQSTHSLNTQIVLAFTIRQLQLGFERLLAQGPTNSFKPLLVLHHKFHDFTLWIHDINLLDVGVGLE